MTPDSLYTAAECRALDKAAMELVGIPEYTLMSRAGERAFRVLRETWPAAKTLAIVCGSGNNGGDGFVLARLAKSAGLRPMVLFLGDEGRLKGPAQKAFQELKAVNATISIFGEERLKLADIVVDAVFGTGIERPVTGRHAEAIAAMNACNRPVLALDLPSGLNADTGAVMGCAVRANVTVTFIALKRGLYTHDGPDHAGELVFEGLDVPSEVFGKVAASARLNRWESVVLPERLRNTHKGDYGHVLVIGGDTGMAGAVRLTGEAALRAGAGLVTVATRPEHAVFVATFRPELMGRPVTSAEDLKPLLARADVIAIGPGLGLEEWSRGLWRAVLSAGLPLVVDADALNLLAENPCKREDWVLTPHPGEAARMLGMTREKVQNDRFAAAEALRARYGGVAVLKGCGTIVASEPPLAVCAHGTPAMASAGMGDALTGVIAAFLAQGMSPSDSACIAVSAHARAGDAAAAGGRRAVLAGEVIAKISDVLSDRG